MPLLTPAGFFRNFPPADVFDTDFRKTLAVPTGFTFARTSTAWDSSLASYASGVPVITAANGLYVQGARTNLYLNSSAPATQTIASMAAGTYVCWVIGTGSVAVSGGASGTATAASPFSFTLGSTLSCTFTKSGTLSYVSVELASFATLPIVTAGAAVTRNTESCSATRSAITTGTVAIWHRSAKGTGAVQVVWCLDDGTTSNQWRVGRNASGVANLVRNSAGSGVTTGAGTLPDDTDLCLVVAFAGGDTAFRTNVGGSVNGTASSPATAPTIERIGSVSGAGSLCNTNIYRVARWSTRLADPYLDALAATFR